MKTGSLLLWILFLGFFLPVHAQDRAQVILVLDASGSMWKRVEKKEKILIARQVVSEILEGWNENTNLGVIAYGHRRKGDCNDIETVVPLGPADVDAIRQTVERIRPKGKTPLSAAVRKAAQELRFTEERATVILVSDGKETCNLDPCVVGRELEEAGVDFTAHVIGFDIADDERAQLQCLAEATGGQYFDAQKSEELKVALAEAVQQVQIQPDQVVAVLAEGLPPLTDDDVQWDIKSGAGEATSSSGAVLTLPAGPDVYTVTARLGQADGSATLEVKKDEFQQHVVVLNAGRLVLKATASGPEGAIKNPSVQWSIENLAEESEVASISAPEASLYLNGETYGVFASFEGMEQDQIVTLESGGQQELVFNFHITLAQLEAPDTAPAGAGIDIVWQGPDNKNDYLSVAAPGEPDRRYVNYAYTRNGSPAKLQMPDKPGIYELRYISGQSKTALVRRPITITEVTSSLNALDVVPVAKPIQIEWQGPDNRGDYLSVAEAGSPDRKYIKYIYTNRGNPAQLVMPDQPGLYELRYVMGQSKTVLARRPIKVVLEQELPQGETAGTGEVILQAVDSATGEPIQENLTWMVYRLEGGAQEIHKATDPQPRFGLQPGRYRAVVSAGSVSKTVDFNLNAGESITRSIPWK